MTDQEALTTLAAELEALSERLADLALDQLRTAADAHGEGDEAVAVAAEQLERRITRARRSVEKAAGLLGGPPDSFDDL